MITFHMFQLEKEQKRGEKKRKDSASANLGPRRSSVSSECEREERGTYQSGYNSASSEQYATKTVYKPKPAVPQRPKRTEDAIKVSYILSLKSHQMVRKHFSEARTAVVHTDYEVLSRFHKEISLNLGPELFVFRGQCHRIYPVLEPKTCENESFPCSTSFNKAIMIVLFCLMRPDSRSVGTMLLANNHLHQPHYFVCGESAIISSLFLLTKLALLTLFLFLQTVAS